MAIIEDMGETVGTTRGTMTRRQWESMDKTPKAAKVAKEEKRCPLKGTPCRSNCALWNGASCRIIEGGNLRVAGVCPMSNARCGDGCAMYKNGDCAIF